MSSTATARSTSSRTRSTSVPGVPWAPATAARSSPRTSDEKGIPHAFLLRAFGPGPRCDGRALDLGVRLELARLHSVVVLGARGARRDTEGLAGRRQARRR